MSDHKGANSITDIYGDGPSSQAGKPSIGSVRDAYPGLGELNYIESRRPSVIRQPGMQFFTPCT